MSACVQQQKHKLTCCTPLNCCSSFPSWEQQASNSDKNISFINLFLTLIFSYAKPPLLHPSSSQPPQQTGGKLWHGQGGGFDIGSRRDEGRDGRIEGLVGWHYLKKNMRNWASTQVLPIFIGWGQISEPLLKEERGQSKREWHRSRRGQPGGQQQNCQ
jgi:hypothetical protein